MMFGDLEHSWLQEVLVEEFSSSFFYAEEVVIESRG